MPLSYQIVTFAGNSTVSLFHGGKAYIANMDHPSWDKIIEGVKAGDESVVDLFDIAGTINRKFARLSGRFTVENGVIKLDGDSLNNAFTRKVLEVLESGSDDWQPLVNFGENILQNPSEYSRSQLFDFLDNNVFAINQDGMIVAHKGLITLTPSHSSGKDYRSSQSGYTEVSVNDAEAVIGYVYQSVGDEVSMARSLVDDNSGIMCSTGLHISTFDYAKSYGDVILDVLVHPRDVVSVPNERGFEKVRCCRYINLRISSGPITEPVVFTGPPEVTEPEPVVVEGNIPETGSRVRTVQGASWTNPVTNKEVGLPWMGFNVGDEGTILDALAVGYSKEDSFLTTGHLLFKRDSDGAHVWLHETSFEVIPHEPPVVEPSNAAEENGFAEGDRVILNDYQWIDLLGTPVYNRDYFVERNLQIGTEGVVAKGQRGALSEYNVKVTFSNDWTVWVAPNHLTNRD